MLAECAQVEGKISLDLQQASIPLGSAVHGAGDGAKQAVAVVNAIHPIPGAAVRSDSPRRGGAQSDSVSGKHEWSS